MHLDSQHVLDRSPASCFFEAVGMVMIADDKMLVAFEARQVDIMIGESKVTEMVNGIAGSDDLVPPLDHGFVHLFDGLEWSQRQFYDAGVAEVGIRREPSLHLKVTPSPCFHSKLVKSPPSVMMMR